ncbi:TetR/AcrR family transcriptional regulator [Nitrospirillum viridazoti]|uniref:TetR family transcriptional regulator n=1 Tax=Nitrospirillum viridazoti CBAmc TaxID=1441467 RepID=A0A248JYE1_9PROT|nr:TetR/AcrR family transcriptional regulator [Nitrospirillum amazonense]ASG23511.1 TetR family transcriptional regulator [Nitrospirillum amazonense CBAmc]
MIDVSNTESAGPISRRAKSAEKRDNPEARPRPPRPTAGRALETYEKLVTAAGELLAEVGFERLTSNAVCARVQVTPPAFYRYFNDKYEVLEELAERLLKKQNDAFAVWLFRGGAWGEPAHRVAALEAWFRTAADIVAKEPGGIWTIRALRALPNLAHIRLKSQRQFTDQMCELARRLWPQVPPDLLWYRLRIGAEFGYVIDELALEEDRLPSDVLFREAAYLISGLMDGLVRTEETKI